MKLHKKPFILISGVLFLIAGIYFSLSARDNSEKITVGETTQLKDHAPTKMPVPKIKTVTITKNKDFKKGIASSDETHPLENFEHNPLRNAPGHLFLVKNVLASNQSNLTLKKISTLGGINFYHAPKDTSQVPGSLPVVFNSKTGDYGMLSGEIIIRRYYEQAKRFAEDSGITIVSDDPKAYMLIIREDDVERLQDLLGETALEKSRPKLDIIYYLNQPK